MIIAVDFDGTLHMGKWPEIGLVTPCAVKMMQLLAADGHYIIINTAREGQRLTEAINWMLERDIPFHRVNDNHPANTERYQSNSRKIYAHVYVDDKQVGGLPTWPEIYDYIAAQERTN